MDFIRTLNGDIPPGELGVTYAHDHLFCVPPLWKEKNIIITPHVAAQNVDPMLSRGGEQIWAVEIGRASCRERVCT